MADAPSFPQSYSCIQPSNKSPTKIRSATSANFHLLIFPLFDHKIILTFPFFYTLAIFHLP